MLVKGLSKLNIQENDINFFFPLAAIAGFLMQLSSVLPFRITRNYFSNIIFDHLPWSTIVSIFIVQVLIVLFYHSIKNEKRKQYAHDMVQHIAEKLVQFCSPAFSVMLGLSLATTCWALATLNSLYLNYSLGFALFSLFFIILPWFSNHIKTAVNVPPSETKKELLEIIGWSSLVALLLVPIFNDNPVEVSYKLSVGEFDTVESAAEAEQLSVSELSRNSVIDRAMEINANQALNRTPQ